MELILTLTAHVRALPPGRLVLFPQVGLRRPTPERDFRP